MSCRLCSSAAQKGVQKPCGGCSNKWGLVLLGPQLFAYTVKWVPALPRQCLWAAQGSATCLFQICSQLSRLPWELLCSQALPLSKARSLTSLGFSLSALGIYQAHEAASRVVFPDKAAHSEHCRLESEGDNQVAWEMRKHCCVLFSACPRAQGVPQQLGMEEGNEHQGLLREVGCTDPYSWMGLSPRSCQWWTDSAGNNHSDSDKALGTGSVLCLSLRWRAWHRKPCLESCRGAGRAAFGGHCKHAIGQEGTRGVVKDLWNPTWPDWQNCLLWWIMSCGDWEGSNSSGRLSTPSHHFGERSCGRSLSTLEIPCEV